MAVPGRVETGSRSAPAVGTPDCSLRLRAEIPNGIEEKPRTVNDDGF